MRSFVICVAAVGLAVSPTHAAPDNGKDKRGGPSAAAEKNRGNANGKPKAPKAAQPRVDREKGNSGNNPGRGNGDKERGVKERVERAAERRIDDRIDRKTDRGAQKRATDRGSDRTSDRNILSERIGFSSDRRIRGAIDGCPPGLAKKNAACLPPGLAKQKSRRAVYDRPDYFGFDRFDDGRYFYDDGYLFKMDGPDRVYGYLPLLGGALAVGQAWPSFYQPSPLPEYYSEYYNLGQASDYRYADDVIYRVDPKTAAIKSIAALLTGDDFSVGSPMPQGYDVYNVPYAHRETYYDRPDAMYRYSDGYVYQIDPKTRLITSAIELLT